MPMIFGGQSVQAAGKHIAMARAIASFNMHLGLNPSNVSDLPAEGVKIWSYDASGNVLGKAYSLNNVTVVISSVATGLICSVSAGGQNLYTARTSGGGNAYCP